MKKFKHNLRKHLGAVMTGPLGAIIFIIVFFALISIVEYFN